MDIQQFFIPTQTKINKQKSKKGFDIRANYSDNIYSNLG
jgi:hypothetical protein